jgi:hypothetical protein
MDLLDVAAGAYLWAEGEPVAAGGDVRIVTAGPDQLPKELLDRGLLPDRATGAERYPTGLFFSDDGCTAAYRAGSLKAPSVGVVPLCGPSDKQVTRYAIEDVVRDAKVVVTGWEFGSDCKPPA